ncbi:MAG TPA: hypothetical protein PLZ15_10580 [Melioribacteraceae bacterium]|nr:hypothetical protein [Melioribacteraceae bacterium]
MKRYSPHSFTLLICASLFISCQDILESSFISFDINEDFDKYKISTAALLPMRNDDTTSTGTFYSTNYFYNRLLKNEKFMMIDIDKFIASDSVSITQQVKSLKRNGVLNLKILFGTNLGSFLLTESVDAIIVGDIKKNEHYYYTWYGYSNHLMITVVTKCDFIYYMASLQDGKILWKADLCGYDSYADILFKGPYHYPPVDQAISNGIDVLLEELNKLFLK